MDLQSKKCIPCEAGVAPFTHEQAIRYIAELKATWELDEAKKIRAMFQFKDFKAAMEFVNKVAALAEVERHHPDIHISYNRVTIELWTHAIGGLSENDFILASKIERLFSYAAR